MRPAAGLRHGMAYIAPAERSIRALELLEFDRVVRLTAFGDSMRAVMAAFAVDPAVTGREAVERRGLLEGRSGSVLMAGVAARLVQPGVGVLRHVGHCAVTVNAVHLASRIQA